jgi:sialate O-acetylesterase
MKKIILLAILIFSFGNIYSQKKNDNYWNNKKSCVVLTYDDATDSHLDYVLPVLDSLNIKATFYIPGHSLCLYQRTKEWKTLAKNGHELGNHTLFHPCHGKSLNRKWVNQNHDLDNYSVQQFLDEIRVQNTLLKALDGKNKRTFAYTCGDLEVDGKSIVRYMKDYFVAARGVQRGLNYQHKEDLYNLVIYGVKNDDTLDKLKSQVDKAINEKALLIFLFHGVEKGTPLSTSYTKHKALVEYITSKENEIWIAPMIEVAEFITNSR